MYDFGIEVALRDVQLIYKVKDLLLGGIGTVFLREKEGRSKTVF